MLKATINNRIQLKQIEVHQINDKESRVELVLSLNEHSESVEKVGSSDKATELMTIGLATLDCIKLLISRSFEYQISYIKEVKGKENTLNAVESLLRLKEGGKEVLLNGTALIRTSIYEAVVESLLNALSLTLEKMIQLQQNREKSSRSGAFAIADLSTIELSKSEKPSLELKASNIDKADKIDSSIAKTEEDPLNNLIKISQAKELFDKAETLIKKGNYIAAKQTLRKFLV